MIFYHGTTKDNAELIETSSLNPSDFDVKEYLINTIKVKSGRLGKGYIDNNDKYTPVKWLGKGIYLFDFLNKKEAETWSSRYPSNNPTPIEDCTTIKVTLRDIPEEYIFDLFSYSDIIKLKDTLNSKFDFYIAGIDGLDLATLKNILLVKKKF